jgi:cytochrome d ubiquinol oxidase subunit II
VFVLGGLVLYVVLGGADFGAGWWQLTAGGGERGERIRELAHQSMSPVWEANHVWLIFVLTVSWTAYPTAFASIASTLSVALFIAAIGLIARGALYALRTAADPPEQRRIDTYFGVFSVVTPFALGAAVGGIASGRVPVGNAAGDLMSSWLNPTSIAVGLLAVASGAYLAAVYLAADARHLGERELEDAYRRRALGAGLLAGALAAAGLVVLHSDAHDLYRDLVAGAGLPPLIVSALAGLATLALVWSRRFEVARYAAAVAVAAIVAGWALAQNPILLPGLTVEQAAASHATLVAVVIAVVAGGLILFPSLATLFRLTLAGRLGGRVPDSAEAGPVALRLPGAAPAARMRIAVAALIAGVVLVNVADSEVAHAIGAVLFIAFAAGSSRELIGLALREAPESRS